MLSGLIRNSVISDIQELDNDQIVALMPSYQTIIDLFGLVPIPEVGWSFDGMNVINPATGLPCSKSIKITQVGLLGRFTFPEKVTIQSVAAGLNTNGYTMKAWILEFETANYIDLSRPETIAGIQWLESSGLIAPGRSETILTTPLTQTEMYRG